MSRRTASLIRRAAITAGVALAVAPAGASAASPWQFDNFRLFGGSRYTLTVSKQTQLPGVDPAIWPKGYRYVCKESGPGLRARLNYPNVASDIVELYVRGAYATPGSLSFKRFGAGETSQWFGADPPPTPRTVEMGISLSSMVGSFSGPATAPLSPPLGLYDFQVIPTPGLMIWPGYSVVLPAAQLPAKLDVRQGTAAECPPLTTEQPRAYFRASK